MSIHSFMTRRVNSIGMAMVSLLILTGIMAPKAKADGLIIMDEPVEVIIHPDRPPIRTHTPMHVKKHIVEVTIKDQIATTTIDQVFHNPTRRRLEGKYIFPLPKGAEIDNFTMDINGEMTKAELLDANKARRIYEDIVRSMKDPALMEYAGQGMMTVRIFPIEPMSDKRIRITYTQVLKNDDGIVEYMYPLNTEKWSSKNLETCSVKVTIHSDDKLKSIYSPSHEVEVIRKSNNKAVVGFEARNVKPDTDFKLIYQTQRKKNEPVGINLVTYDNADEHGGYFMLMTSPGLADTDQILPKDIVFVLDTSGSMRGDKIKQAQAALQTCIENLNDEDRFQVIRFSTEAEPMFDKLMKANKTNRDSAVEMINTYRPIGGTAINDALQVALEFNDNKERPYYVIFLTDGHPTIGEQNEDIIVGNVKKTAADSGVRIFNFGIGTEINTHLLDKIAHTTRSFSQYVLPTENIEVKVSNFYQKIAAPVLADISIKIHGDVKISQVMPIHMPDLYRGEQLLIFGRYKGNGDAAVVIEGKLLGETRKIVREVHFDDHNTDHPFVARLWATRRVGYLLNQIRLNGESSELRDEVTRIARKHGIVTPYTSYLILEDERRRSVPMEARTLSDRSPGNVMRDEAEAGYSGNFKKEGKSSVAAADNNRLQTQAENSPAAVDDVWSERMANEITRQRMAEGEDADKTLELRQKMYTGKNKQVVQQRNGRTFYDNGSQWIDAEAQFAAAMPKKRIQFMSDEYFALLKKNDDVAKWLSIGSNMQLVYDNTLYEIYE